MSDPDGAIYDEIEMEDMTLDTALYLVPYPDYSLRMCKLLNWTLYYPRRRTLRTWTCSRTSWGLVAHQSRWLHRSKEVGMVRRVIYMDVYQAERMNPGENTLRSLTGPGLSCRRNLLGQLGKFKANHYLSTWDNTPHYTLFRLWTEMYSGGWGGDSGRGVYILRLEKSQRNSCFIVLEECLCCKSNSPLIIFLDS